MYQYISHWPFGIPRLLVPVLILAGLGVLPLTAAASPCKTDGIVCVTSRSCCGTNGNNGTCVKDTGAKFGLCCTKSNGGTEACDGLDNDCDGHIDEGVPGTGDACDTGDLGVCAAGTITCRAGTLACVADVEPSAELCDGLDNDCDGSIDDVTVINTDDAGAGSLRAALEAACVDGIVTFAPALAGQTITLTSGPLIAGKNVTVDGSAAPDLVVSGNDTDRVFIVNTDSTATLSHLIVRDGYGFELAGGILNNGSLTLDHTTVTQNTMTTAAGDYWQGGGGIYNGNGAVLNLIDSSVADNQAAWSGGGIFAFFNSSVSIVRSTISGNTSADVGGAIRSFGTVTITNSTVSSNTAAGWHGGAIFHTDGSMKISNSTIANNNGPDWAPSAIFIGEWGVVIPSLELTNTIVTGNHWYACEQYASGGTVSLTSGGHNLFQDASCNPVASDLIISDAQIGALADNGGPTSTHALLPGSPALDAADDASCPPLDQRGVARPAGAHCDIGSYEAQLP